MAFDREIAALTCFCEASGEPYEGKVAVISTMFNRVRVVGRWEPTVAGVCLQRMQFSEWNDDPWNNRNLLRGANAPVGDREMLDCLRAYDEARQGRDASLGATHYFAPAVLTAAPKWTVGATFLLQIGRHRFYKDVP